MWGIFDFVTLGVFEKKTQAKTDWASDESQNRNASGSNTSYSNWSPYPNDTKDGASSNDNYNNDSDKQRGTKLGNNGLLQGADLSSGLKGVLTKQNLYDTSKEDKKQKPKPQNKAEQKKEEAPKPVVAPPQPPAQKVETNIKKEEPKPAPPANAQEPPKKSNVKSSKSSEELSKKIAKEKEALEAVKQKDQEDQQKRTKEEDTLISYLSLKSAQHSTQLDRNYVESVFESYSIKSQANALAESTSSAEAPEIRVVTKGNAILAYEDIMKMWKIDLTL